MTEIIIVQIDADLEDIVPSFLENRKKDLEQIEIFLKEKDWGHIESIAHKLAGNAGSYGFNELGEIGIKLEEACQQAQFEEIKKYCDQYYQYMDNVKVEYK